MRTALPIRGVKSLWPPLSMSFGNGISESLSQKVFEFRKLLMYAAKFPFRRVPIYPLHFSWQNIKGASAWILANTGDYHSADFSPI